MLRGRQYIRFEAYFAENVLGIFRVIHGIADLRDLAQFQWQMIKRERKINA